MLLTKLPFITRINSIGCELPLLGGWGVLCFSEWTLLMKNICFLETQMLQVNNPCKPD